MEKNRSKNWTRCSPKPVLLSWLFMHILIEQYGGFWEKKPIYIPIVKQYSLKSFNLDFWSTQKNENDNKMTIYASFQFNLLTKTVEAASQISNWHKKQPKKPHTHLVKDHPRNIPIMILRFQIRIIWKYFSESIIALVLVVMLNFWIKKMM